MDTWERSAPPIYDEPSLIPKSEVELSARSRIENTELTEAEAPPLVSKSIEPAKSFEPANENSELADEKPVPPHKPSVSSTTPEGASSLAAASGSKTVSSFGLRTIAIIGMLSFVAGATLGIVLFSKSGWNSHDQRSGYQANASVSHPAVTETTSMVAPVADGSLSETTNQLRAIGTELNSLRKELGSISGEVAQIRKAQEELIAAQAQLARKPQRPDSRTQGR
jgi:hypothetical protein